MFVAVFNKQMILVIQYHKYAELMVGFDVEHKMMHDCVCYAAVRHKDVAMKMRCSSI